MIRLLLSSLAEVCNTHRVTLLACSSRREEKEHRKKTTESIQIVMGRGIKTAEANT